MFYIFISINLFPKLHNLFIKLTLFFEVRINKLIWPNVVDTSADSFGEDGKYLIWYS